MKVKNFIRKVVTLPVVLATLASPVRGQCVDHKAKIYPGEGDPNVLLNLIGPATYPVVKVGNDGLEFNYGTDEGNHIVYEGNGAGDIVGNLDKYLENDGCRLYTDCGEDSKRRNLANIIEKEGEDVVKFREAIKDGKLSPEEVYELRDSEGTYGLWVLSKDDKTGNVEASVPVLLDIDYTEPGKVVDVTVDYGDSCQVKDEDVSGYNNWKVAGGARIFEEGEAPEFSIVGYLSDKFGIGGYASFGPSHENYDLELITGDPSPEGIHGEGRIETKSDKNYTSFGPVFSFRSGNWSFDVAPGIGKVSKKKDERHVARLLRGDEVLDQDIDVCHKEDSYWTGDVSGNVNIPLGDNVSAYVGAGSLNGDGYGKIGAGVRF